MGYTLVYALEWMHCFHLIVPYAVLLNSTALFLDCVNYRLNWTGKGVDIAHHIFSITDLGVDLIIG